MAEFKPELKFFMGLFPPFLYIYEAIYLARIYIATINAIMAIAKKANRKIVKTRTKYNVKENRLTFDVATKEK